MGQEMFDQQTNQDRDYIHALIEDLESDKKSILLYLAFEVGMIVVVMTKIFPNENFLPFLVLLSLTLLLISVLLFFLYFRALHCARVEVTLCLRKQPDADKAHQIVKSGEAGIWPRHKAKYNWAKGLLFAGVGLYLLYLWFLYACKSGIVQSILQNMCQP